ncbi:MAG: NUDIX hydrolase [Cyanobacteria bacterium J06632_22]
MADDAAIKKVEVAIAILHQNNQFLMQLRDDIPGIFYPGHWGFFGGHIESGETADQGVRRELIEEIGYAPLQLSLFQRTEDDRVVRHFYHGALTVPVEQLQLNEGQDIGLCTIPDVKRGFKFSKKLGEDRPLGLPHQHALITFIEQDL